MMKATHVILVAALLAVVCGLGPVGPAHGFLISDGSIYNETFTGNAMSEPGSLFFPTSGDVGFGTDNAQWANLDNSDGTYQATGLALGANDEYAISIDFSMNAPLAGCCLDPPIYRAKLLDPTDATQSFGTDVRLGVLDNPDGTTWDIFVQDANSGSSPLGGAYDPDHGTLLGLSLARNQVHTIGIQHMGNGANEIDVWVNGVNMGTFIDRDPVRATQMISMGNISDAPGLVSATMDNFSIGIPEPAALALLSLGGLAALRRRR